MELIELKLKNELDDFVISRSREGGAEFLQAWFWGEIEEETGREIKRFGVVSKGESKGGDSSRGESRLVAVAVLIKQALPAGFFYWYSPRGPLGDKKAVEFLIKEIDRRYPRAVFLRFEPEMESAFDSEGAVPGYSRPAGLVLKKSLDLQPKQSLIIDLDRTEEEILSAMHQKTRYNIRLAEKKGVIIEEGGAGNFEEFWNLMNKTGERDAFRLHSRKHYQALLAGSSPIRLYLARYEGKAIAAGLFCFWGDKVTYLHGASDNDQRNLMAPYLLQWEMMRRAKIEGYKYYDFFGIDEKKWPGVTRFKLGFSGRRVVYPGTTDAVFRPAMYKAYNFLRGIRRRLG